jgi:hypothetical protein
MNDRITPIYLTKKRLNPRGNRWKEQKIMLCMGAPRRRDLHAVLTVVNLGGRKGEGARGAGQGRKKEGEAGKSTKPCSNNTH